MKFYLFILINILFFACNEINMSELHVIHINTDQDSPLPLSSIVEEIKSIELELTDESLINPSQIVRVCLLNNSHVIIAEKNQILLFSIDGTFIRSIGSRGQGPGEFINILNLAIDEKNKHIFVGSSKIICYDLDGTFLRESYIAPEWLPIKDINYINNELLIIVENVDMKDSKGAFQHSVVLKMNNNLQIIDSCAIRDTYFQQTTKYSHAFHDFIFLGNENIQLYYSDIYSNRQNPLEIVLRDTLYLMKNNHLIPEIKLKFKNDGIDGYGNKFIHLYNIYRSSRYVFAFYRNDYRPGLYNFCYDLQTGKGYNIKDGYTDDIYKIQRPLRILPFNLDTEFFYYLHTNIHDYDLVEPNPTLYIGKLKK